MLDSLNKSVKASLTRDVRKNAVIGVGSHVNTAVGITLCCICHSTPPLVLYFLYITSNGALTHKIQMHTDVCYTHARTHTHAQRIVCASTHTCTCNTRTHMHASMQAQTHTSARMHAHAHARTHARTHTHTHTHTHLHTKHLLS